VFLINGKDVQRDSYTMNDGMRGADILMADSPAQRLGPGGDSSAAVSMVIETSLVALCAEAIGTMSKMLLITVDFLKNREQFGQPLSSFQALRFRATELFVALEQSRSLVLLARHALNHPNVARAQIIRAAKVHVDASCRLFSDETIQLHGGIGMTMESSIGHYAKRTTMISKMFAEPGALLERIAANGGLITASS
jgi:alkylation response protein AidB-like acyl-CoA dehydrogenase